MLKFVTVSKRKHAEDGEESEGNADQKKETEIPAKVKMVDPKAPEIPEGRPPTEESKSKREI